MHSPLRGGHPGPGVNVLLILNNFPARITKSGSGTKKNQIEITTVLPPPGGKKCNIHFWSAIMQGFGTLAIYRIYSHICRLFYPNS